MEIEVAKYARMKFARLFWYNPRPGLLSLLGHELVVACDCTDEEYYVLAARALNKALRQGSDFIPLKKENLFNLTGVNRT